MNGWTIELDEEAYRIVAPDGAESDAVEYGEPAVLEYEGDLYVAVVPGTEEEHESLGLKVFRLEPQETEVEDVEFEFQEID